MPYADDALEPHISQRTIGFHYNKHHQGYMKKLDAALKKDDPLREQDLEHIIKNSEGGIFNSAAQVWNHTFYWNSLCPKGTSAPSNELAAQIDKDFGGMGKLQQELKDHGAGQFGSGWAWLCWDPKAKKLSVLSTSDAETPITDGLVALLTLDVWEHAYYLDYQNDRGDYLDHLVEHLLNWEFANRNFASA